MSCDQKLMDLLKSVLDIEADEVVVDEPLDQSLGIDSTEMVEICVAIKKEFNLDIENNTFKKSQSFNEILKVIHEKQ